MVLFDVLSDEERKRIRDAMPGPADEPLEAFRPNLTRDEFKEMAWTTANAKARDKGWIVSLARTCASFSRQRIE